MKYWIICFSLNGLEQMDLFLSPRCIQHCRSVRWVNTTVPHRRLFGKLEAYGIEGDAPKFTRWKNANVKAVKDRNKYRRKVLLDEIRDKHVQLRKHKEDLRVESALLFANMTFMKKWMVKKSIQNIVDIDKKLVQKRHSKKLSGRWTIQTKPYGTSHPTS